MNCCGSGSHEPKPQHQSEARYGAQQNNNQKDHNHGQEISDSQNSSNGSRANNLMSSLQWILMLGLAGYFLWSLFN